MTTKACPVTGSNLNTLPANHPEPVEGKVCPVTNASTSHHPNVVPHPQVPATASAKDCPVLSKAADDKVCPVVGTSTANAVLPPDHPAPTSGLFCPATKATLAHHKDVIHEHPPVAAGASAKDCPVLSKKETSTPEKCPITGSKVQSLPPDHPSTANGGVCPVTQASVVHHDGIVKEHPSVASGATAKDCPVLQKAESAGACPVVGTTAATLPPAHPEVKAGQACPVTGATASHHETIAEHPSVASADSQAKCPVTGAVAEHHKVVDSDAGKAQCPVTGQYADGTRPAVVLPAAIAEQPIKYTLYGTPFSTFTRTVAMGLHELQIPFTQVDCKPHSEEILKYNPFGKLPALVLEHSGKQMPMFESDSIIRYLDSADDRVLRFPARDMVKNQKVEEWIGIISNIVFSAVELGVVKPYLADKSADVTEALAKMHKVLAIVEDRSQKPYLMGIATTWADLYLYPILADLSATPYARELERYTKLSAWVMRMSKRSTALATRPGTLESM